MVWGHFLWGEIGGLQNLAKALKPDHPVLGGPIAQLGERLHGMQEVVGSIPIGSTIICYSSFLNIGLRPLARLDPPVFFKDFAFGSFLKI